MEIRKDLIVKRTRSSNGLQIIGTCADLFPDTKARPLRKSAKGNLSMDFVYPDGTVANVMLSKRLKPEYETGKIDQGTFLTLPVYRVPLFETEENTNVRVKDENGEFIPITDEDDNQVILMIAGKPLGSDGVEMSELLKKKDKFKAYEPVTEDSFDDILAL